MKTNSSVNQTICLTFQRGNILHIHLGIYLLKFCHVYSLEKAFDVFKDARKNNLAPDQVQHQLFGAIGKDNIDDVFFQSKKLKREIEDIDSTIKEQVIELSEKFPGHKDYFSSLLNDLLKEKDVDLEIEMLQSLLPILKMKKKTVSDFASGNKLMFELVKDMM